MNKALTATYFEHPS